MSAWKVIIGFPDYSVSDDGRVKNNKTDKILSPYTDTNGYLSVGLYRDSKRFARRIHKLAAEAFIPNPLDLRELNHKDGNKQNNIIDNLEWCTRSYNMIHSTRTLGNKPKKPYVQPIICVESMEVYKNVEEAAKAVNRSSMAIRKCLYGWTKTAAGRHWRYAV